MNTHTTVDVEMKYVHRWHLAAVGCRVRARGRRARVCAGSSSGARVLLLPRQEEHLLLLMLLLAKLLLLLNAHFVKAGHGDAPSALPETMVKTRQQEERREDRFRSSHVQLQVFSL